MTIRRLLLASLFIAVSVGRDAVAAESERVRVLILTGANNHDWAATTPVLKELFERSPRFAVVDVVDDPARLDAATLARCDVIVSNWSAYPNMTGHQWGAAAERAFVEFIRGGKGFVVFHAASATCHDWPEFQQLVARTWGADKTGHGAYETFQVRIDDVDHPITDGLRDFWTTDELWHSMVQVAPTEFHTLASAFAGFNIGGSGKVEPVLLTTRLGEGRGVNLVLGHDVHAMRNAAWRTLMLRGSEWAATGQVTIPVPDDWPSTPAAAALTGLDPEAIIQAAATYRFGQDRRALLAVEQLINRATSLPPDDVAGQAARQELANRLAKAIVDAPAPEAKSFLCRQLSLIGTAEHVPVLRALLDDEQVAYSARFALERIGVASAYRWQKAEDSLALLNGDHVVWRFNYGEDQPKPCFHPLALPDGTELTWLSPPDHVWHRALWFSWKEINGVNYWEEDPKTGFSAGRTDLVSCTTKPNDDHSARIEMKLSYHPPDRPAVLTEERSIEVSAPDDDGAYHIDWKSTFAAGADDVVLKGGTVRGGYAGLAVRIAGDTHDWRILDSEGREDGPSGGVGKNTWGKHSRWADFSLVSSKMHRTAGIAVLDHPGNFRHPVEWHNIIDERVPFGYFNPAPLWSDSYHLPAGGRFALRYRILVHPGRGDASRIERAWKAWTTGTD